MNKNHLISVFFVLLSAVSCNDPNHLAQHAQETQNYRALKAKTVISNLVYIKDVRTGICFAYAWEGQGNGGPALTSVQCDKIPPNLLTEHNPGQ